MSSSGAGPAGRGPVLPRVRAVLRSPALRWGFVVVAVAAAVAAVVLEREAVAQALRRVPQTSVVLALVLSLVSVVLATLSWRSVSAGLGAPLGLRDATVVYLVGQVGKYLPGGVWNLLASAELGSDRGISRRRTVGTLLLAVLISAAMGGLLAVLTLPGVRGTPLQDRGELRLLAPLAVLAVLPVVLNRLLATLLRLTRREPVDERLGGGAVAESALWALASWVAVGMQVYVLAVAVGGDPGMPLLRLSAGGYALAWIVGSTLVFLPAGVGAREAVLALALAPVLGTGGVLVVVLLSRVLLTGADLGAAGLALLVSRLHPPGR